jgi:hypothetical protein
LGEERSERAAQDTHPASQQNPLGRCNTMIFGGCLWPAILATANNSRPELATEKRDVNPQRNHAPETSRSKGLASGPGVWAYVVAGACYAIAGVLLARFVGYALKRSRQWSRSAVCVPVGTDGSRPWCRPRAAVVGSGGCDRRGNVGSAGPFKLLPLKRKPRTKERWRSVCRNTVPVSMLIEADAGWVAWIAKECTT